MESRWPSRQISECAKVYSGFAFKSQDLGEDGIPVVKIKNVNNRTVDIADTQFFPEELVTDKHNKFFLDDGDVLIAMTGQGSVGRVGRLSHSSKQRILLNQRVGKFVSKENLNLRYFFYVASSNYYEEIFFNAGLGSGQPNLSPDVIGQVEIPLPPLREQKAIEEYDLDDQQVATRITHGVGLDTPVALSRGDAAGGFESFFLGADARGDIVAAADPGTGELVEEAVLSPWGERTFYDQSGMVCAEGLEDGQGGSLPRSGCAHKSIVISGFGIAGARVHPHTKLADLRARTYATHLKSFLVPDPLGSVDSFGLWNYVAGDPVNLRDPLGLDTPEDVEDPTPEGAVEVFFEGDVVEGRAWSSPSDPFTGTTPYQNELFSGGEPFPVPEATEQGIIDRFTGWVDDTLGAIGTQPFHQSDMIPAVGATRMARESYGEAIDAYFDDEPAWNVYKHYVMGNVMTSLAIGEVLLMRYGGGRGMTLATAGSGPVNHAVRTFRSAIPDSATGVGRPQQRQYPSLRGWKEREIAKLGPERGPRLYKWYGKRFRKSQIRIDQRHWINERVRRLREDFPNKSDETVKNLIQRQIEEVGLDSTAKMHQQMITRALKKKR